MTHVEISFENLSQALSRCGEKLANEAINEIRTAINCAVAQAASATEVDTLLQPMQTTITAAQTARREKAAARRAARKANRLGSCGEAEAELPATSPSPCSLEARLGVCEGRGEAAEAAEVAEAFTPEMVKYLRRCPEHYMLSVLNSYFHLILTGNVVHTSDDHRYLDNFIYLTRTVGLIDHDVPPSPEQALAFLCDNPALPLPRAQRREFQRLARKNKLIKSA